MKIVQRIEQLKFIPPELCNPNRKIYAFKGRSVGNQIYVLNHTALADYDENGDSVWSWSTLTAIGGYCGNFKTQKAAFEEALNEGVDIYEFDTKEEFFNWALNVIKCHNKPTKT